MMVILLMPITFVTLVTLITLMSLSTLVQLFWSANQFYRAKCITVWGFFGYIPKIKIYDHLIF